MSLTDEQVKKLKDFLEQQFQIARNTNEEAQYDPQFNGIYPFK